jgi:hypothetical protein
MLTRAVRHSMFAGAMLVAVSMVAACGDANERAPFVEDAASEPVAPREQELPPPSQPPPQSPTGDASAPEPTDCKTAAPSNACGLVPQCGCGPSETCDIVDAKGTVACVAFGKAPMGHPCTATPGCAKGLTCLFGTCHAFCAEPGKACGEPGTGACVQVSGQGGVAIPNLAVCRVECAPHDPASCGGKTNAGVGVCFVDSEGGTDCQEGGTRLQGQTCSPTDDCGPGLVCVKPSVGSDTCKRWCRVGTNDCGGSTQCQSFATKVFVASSTGSTEYGVCP